MRVIWSAKAKTRLREIHNYIAQDSPIRAKQVVDRLTRWSEKLILKPRVDRRVTEYGRDDLREVLDRPFRLIYVVTPEAIGIVTVKHYRQQLPDDPAQL